MSVIHIALPYLALSAMVLGLKASLDKGPLRTKAKHLLGQVGWGGSIAQRLPHMHLVTAVPGSILGVLNNFTEISSQKNLMLLRFINSAA